MSRDFFDPDVAQLGRRMDAGYNFQQVTRAILAQDTEVPDNRKTGTLPQEIARQRSTGKRKNLKSSFKGVCQRDGKWTVKRSTGFTGVYATEIEAARAYDRLMVEVRGARAVTNESLGLYLLVANEEAE